MKIAKMVRYIQVHRSDQTAWEAWHTLTLWYISEYTLGGTRDRFLLRIK